MPGLFHRLFGSRTEAELDARLFPVFHMMLVDGDMDAREMEMFANYASSIGVSGERFQRLVDRVRSGEKFPLPSDPEQKLEVLAAAAAMMTVDGNTAVSELRLLHQLGAMMGVPPEVMSGVMLAAVQFGQRLNPGVDVASDFRAALRVFAAEINAN